MTFRRLNINPLGLVASSPGAAIQPALVLGPTYLLDDEFLTPESAPLASPRTCQPGPGTLVITDTLAQLSIAGQVLSSSLAGVGAGNPGIAPASTTVRAIGLAMIARVKYLSGIGNGGGVSTGWNTSGSLTIGNVEGVDFTADGSVIAYSGGGGSNYPGIVVNGVDTFYAIAVVLRSIGSFFFLNNELVWVILSGTANLRPAVFNTGASRQPFALNWLRVQQLSAPFTDDYGIATFTDTSVADGDTFVGNADAIVDFVYTLPASPSAGQIIGFKFRQSDASNYWIAYIKRNAGNTNWDFLVDSVASGTPTNRITATSQGNLKVIRAYTRGTKLAVYATTSGTPTPQMGTTQDNAFNASATGITAVVAAGASVTRLTSWPLTSSANNVLPTS